MTKRGAHSAKNPAPRFALNTTIQDEGTDA
ncbi:hypothetical protein FHU40_000942 [Nocardioides soli]|uniref:Uncharacterized protein n=1 Tax=Nocardioides soli TaxID=1036020 RepID=A0A7W4VSV7_9ACTN|nr:hypothetical protein [Nocardioides soli]